LTDYRYRVFAADTLLYAVILTFDPLTLKVCGTSSLVWSKSIRNWSKIEQSLAVLLIILRIFAPVHAVTLTFIELLTI